MGNLEFLARLYKFSLYQVVNGDDIVPHMPPRFFARYGDSGDIRHLFPARGGVVSIKGWGQDLFQRLSTLLWRWLSGLVFWTTYVPGVDRVVSLTLRALIADHFIERYAERLRRAA